MTKKWKDFLTITGVTLSAIPGEALWTVFLAKMTSKIPYIGIPTAAMLGLVGAFGALWMGKMCGIAYEDWHNEYYTNE